jgi:hypothetical protein
MQTAVARVEKSEASARLSLASSTSGSKRELRCEPHLLLRSNDAVENTGSNRSSGSILAWSEYCIRHTEPHTTRGRFSQPTFADLPPHSSGV